MVIDPNENGSDDLRRTESPVLKRMFNEPLERNDQRSLVPDAHHHIATLDLFDPPPFAFDDHDVVKAYWLGERKLQSGDEVAEYGTRRNADDQARDSGRCEQTAT